jgi:N-acetyl-anhydromuramyl-L-alanine amidase AmpD
MSINIKKITMEFTYGIKQINFEGNYIKAETGKNQVVLHHTVSNGNAQAVANYWSGLENKIGTAVVIERNGMIVQFFSSKYWAGHVGDVSKECKKIGVLNRNCSKNSIGIELISLGGLKMVNGALRDDYGNKFNGDYVELETPFREYKYFHKYTDEQIKSVEELLLLWNEKYNIPLNYNEDIWDISKRALTGESGVFSHTSYVEAKSDLFPQKELVEMLKNLNK